MSMDEVHREEQSTHKCRPPAAFDIAYLAEGERGKDIMNAVAAEWFEQYPACDFLMVYEDATWCLAYQRGDLERVGTANDLAIMPNGCPQPTHHSGTCVRRQTPATFLSPTPLVGMPYLPADELWNLTADIPGHPKGSTVSRRTLEALGFVVPPRSTPRQDR